MSQPVKVALHHSFAVTLRYDLDFHKFIHRNLEIIVKTALTLRKRAVNVICVDG